MGFILFKIFYSKGKEVFVIQFFPNESHVAFK